MGRCLAAGPTAHRLSGPLPRYAEAMAGQAKLQKHPFLRASKSCRHAGFLCIRLALARDAFLLRPLGWPVHSLLWSTAGL